MDPISIAASVIAILGAATTTYKEISTFVDTIKNGPKEVEDIRKNAGNINNIILNLRDALEEKKIRDVLSVDHLAQKHVKDLEGPLVCTKTTLERITEKLHEHFRPSGDGKAYKLRFQWWKAKEDFQKLLEQLRQDQETLSLSMVGLNTFQTLRTLGGHAGNELKSSQVASENDPASSLRMYAQSLWGDSTTANSPAGMQASLISRKEDSRSSSQNPNAAPTGSTTLTLEAKRELARQKKERQNGLLEASRGGDDMDVEILLGEGAEVDWVGSEGKTALHLAAQYGHKRVAKILLDHGADIEAHCEPFGTPLMILHRAGNTPLHWAAAGDDTGGRQESVARLLLECGASVNARSLRFRTPLQAAIMSTRTGNDATATIRLFLDKGALVNAFDTEGWGPLHEAAYYGKFDIAQILLDHGANTEGRPSESDRAYATNPDLLPGHHVKTPLLLASSQWSEPLIRVLSKYHANLDAQMQDGDTLLHIAAIEGKRTIVPLLLELGANPNIKEFDYGSTPLHKAAFVGYPGIVQALLRGGVNTQSLNNLGQKAVEVARLYGHYEVVDILNKHDKKLLEMMYTTMYGKNDLMFPPHA